MFIPSTSAHRIALALAALAALAGSSLALAGCVHAGGGWPLVVLVAALSLVGVACGRTSASPDAAVDSGGFWESCCEDGVLTTCFCPAGWACNYSRDLVRCPVDTCVYNPRRMSDPTPCDLWDDGPFDAGVDSAVDDLGTDAAVDMSTP